MFNIYLKITAIDYETTIRTILPQVLSKCRETESDNLLIGLLKELGEATEPVLLGILDHLLDEQRQELLCICMEAYGGVMTEQVNKFLEMDQWGRNFTAGRISLKRSEEGLLLAAEQVTADFNTLLMDDGLQDQLGQAAAGFLGDGILGMMARKHTNSILKIATTMVPDGLEQAGISMMKREDIKAKLLKLLRKALSDREIGIEAADLQIELCEDDEKGIASVKPEKFVMSKELESAIVRALASFLKDRVK